MEDAEQSQTSVTLLQRVALAGPPDQDAWKRFAAQYGPRIHAWCLRWKLQEADAEDVTQIVLAKLARQMQQFVYDPSGSFRGWLKTVTHNAWQDFLKGRRESDRGEGGSGMFAVMESAMAREDLVQRLENEFDRELLAQAMEIVKGQVSAQNWQAFFLTAVEGVPAPEAARQLDLKIARVYAARSHIQQRLREVSDELENPP
jgi:RNA polymerase sigma-70 factor (ECF subfamily)